MRLSIQAALAAVAAALAFASPVHANDAPAALAQKAADHPDDKDAPKADPKQEARPAHEAQTHKMVRCNEEAGKKQLHGEERRAFMSACLKG